MFRDLRPDDLPHMTHLCNVGMEHDRFFEGLVREKTIGAHDYTPDLAIGLPGPDDRLLGFVCGVLGRRRELPYAWVRLMVVDPAQRNLGHGGRLLAEFERRARKQGAQRISIMDAPDNYFMPGVDPLYTEGTCFLEKHGYRLVGTNVNLLCDIWPGRFNCREKIESLRREGIVVRRAGVREGRSLEDFLTREFPGWEHEVLSALANDPPIVHIAHQGDEIIAFAAAEGNNKGTGWFGPMGTQKAARGKGVGAVTLQLCLNDLAELGHRHAIIPWVGPVRFYARFCGARRHRTFWVYEKDLVS